MNNNSSCAKGVLSSDKQKTGEGLRLIHEFTIYNHGLNRRHIDFTELKQLINEVIKTDNFVELVITPMYQNSKINLGLIRDLSY
ncbi:hypothetical protein [Priestia sp. 40]|uniref:hypothetical protein n=1 Tax=Priestia sp. 40 TaxID=3394459 RepID=UPI003BF7C207